MKKRTVSGLAADGLLFKNPLLVKMIGLCTAVFACGTVKDALGMGLCTLVVLVLSSLTLSALRGIVTENARGAATLFVVCGFTTVVHLFVKAYFSGLDVSLGIYIPLIAVGSLCYSFGVGFASKAPIVSTLAGSVFHGLGYLVAMLAAAVIRELFGRGQLFGHSIFGGGMTFLTTPAGGFIVLGLLAAVLSFFTRKRRDKNDD